MKSARLTLLTTPEFKAFLGAQAARDGISVAELVRNRCGLEPDADEATLAALTGELRKAVRQAHASLREGLAEAQSTLVELRERRSSTSAAHTPAAKARRAAGSRTRA